MLELGGKRRCAAASYRLGLGLDVHAFQRPMVDTVIAAMEANHSNLTTQKTLHVEISQGRDRAELVAGDREEFQERLEAVAPGCAGGG